VDLASGFIEEARSKAAARQLTMAFKQGDMRDLPWQEEFDGAFCWGNSFGYLDDDGNAAFLKSVARALKPGGRFVLDGSSVAECILPRYEDRSWVQIGDILFLEENHYDHVQGRYDTEYTFVRDGQVEKKFGSHRIYTYREMWRLLEEAGFTNVEGHGSLNQEPFRLGSPGLLLVATKREVSIG
jgi:SAM-dependent methyltransferase